MKKNNDEYIKAESNRTDKIRLHVKNPELEKVNLMEVYRQAGRIGCDISEDASLYELLGYLRVLVRELEDSLPMDDE